ncbi:MAG: response regulator [Nitrospirae bacterium]|nr:MAG: response regulator [Nitrospirota bacterium]
MTLAGKEKLKVLYVEDDEITKAAVSMFISRIAVVITASNGREGLELFLQHQPDIVVTDIAMPVMDGNKMIKMIVQHKADTPIIVTTAYNDSERISCKFCKIVAKPFDKDELITAIKACAENIGLE